MYLSLHYILHVTTHQHLHSAPSMLVKLLVHVHPCPYIILIIYPRCRYSYTYIYRQILSLYPCLGGGEHGKSIQEAGTSIKSQEWLFLLTSKVLKVYMYMQ